MKIETEIIDRPDGVEEVTRQYFDGVDDCMNTKPYAPYAASWYMRRNEDVPICVEIRHLKAYEGGKRVKEKDTKIITITRSKTDGNAA